jgi:phosphatidylinositol glycan class B
LFGYVWGKRAGGSAAIVAAGACAGWYELVYFAPKAFTEVMATNFLLPGLYLATYGDVLPEGKRFFWAGLFLGLRCHCAFNWCPRLDLHHRNWRTRGPVALGGLLLPVVAFGLVDAITWSYPFQSFFLNVWVNIVEKRNMLYGADPWYG